MSLQIHAVVQDAQHIDYALLNMDSAHQQMPSLVTMASHMQRSYVNTQLRAPAHTVQLRAFAQRIKGIVDGIGVNMHL